MTPDPTIRLREIVEAATPGRLHLTDCMDVWLQADDIGIAQFGDISWIGANGVEPTEKGMKANAVLGLAGCRLARAVADPAFVEKVAIAIAEASASGKSWEDWSLDAAKSCLSLLAAHALGEGG